MTVEDLVLDSGAELLVALGQLSSTQLILLESMARAMLVPVAVHVDPDSDIVNTVFAEAMANLLTIHHATHEEPLSKKAFEYLLKSCFLARGCSDARLNPTPGSEGWDVEACGHRWSLKTEAAESISRTQIKIEKLMEARWVREATTPELCATAVSERVPRHLQGYGRILVLRAFRTPDGFEYMLQELPKSVLETAFAGARPADFAKSGKSISFGANFHDSSGQKIFRALLDSSVEKIRVWFSASSAVPHGVWRVHVDAARRAHQSAITS